MELTAGVVHLRPEDAMVEAMLRAGRAQQFAQGLHETSILDRGLLARRFLNVHERVSVAVDPRFGLPDHPTLLLTERGGRLQPVEINARFVAYRDALRLPVCRAAAPFLAARLRDAPESEPTRRAWLLQAAVDSW
ncbi:hypothetical protein WEI85_33235 [Actinomycetes bacterium KLBMP 9797]